MKSRYSQLFIKIAISSVILVIFWSPKSYGFSWREIFSTPLKSEVVVSKVGLFDCEILRNSRGKPHLVIVFHGSGENPRNVMRKWQELASKRRFMVVVPHWGEACQHQLGCLNQIPQVLVELQEKYSFDPKSVSLVGVSSGGGAVQRLVELFPEKWRSIAFFAFSPQGAFPSEELKKMPIYIAFGQEGYEKESVILNQKVQVLKSKGFAVELRIDPQAGHEHKKEWIEATLNWIESVS